MSRKLLSRSALLTSLLLVLAAPPVVWTWRVWRQEKLNQSLTKAILENDLRDIQYGPEIAAQALHLLDEGADPNCICRDPPLSLRQEIIKDVLSLVGRKPRSQDAQPTPLILALRYRPDPALVKALLDKGANVNVESGEGSTPLGEAVDHDSPEGLMVVQMLLDRGADVKASDADYPIICRAAGGGNAEIVRLLIAHGADVNAGGSNRVALMDAMTANNINTENNINTMKVLIANGADVNRKDMTRCTALTLLKQLAIPPQTKKRIAQILKKSGAKE